VPLFAEVEQAFVQAVWLRAVEREEDDIQNAAVQYNAM